MRAPLPRVASSDPGAGLRQLVVLINAVLINDVLSPLGTDPACALAASVPDGMQMSVDVGPAPRPTSRHRPSGTGRPGPTPKSQRAAPQPPPAPEPIGEEHSDTWRLVELAQDGDGEAFGQLYDRYVDMVYRFVYFRVNDRGLAEDFTSETFLRALRRITTISYQGRDIGAWFITIARNIVFDHTKSARHRMEVTTADAPDGDDRAPGPESEVLTSMDNERLMKAVRSLGDEQRECIMLRFIQGLSVSETAAVMGKNEGAVKALQHRAVRKLAEMIGNDLA